MLKKIMSFFKPEKIEEIEVRSSEIEGIAAQEFDDYVKKNILPSFNTLIEEISEKGDIIEESCKILEDSVLKNKNIPLKEKQYMEGNRTSYVKHVRILLKHISVPEDYEHIEESFDLFKERLEEFGRHTMRARQILNHFFEHETNAIHNKISELKTEYDNLKLLIDDERYQVHIKLQKTNDKLKNVRKGKVSLKEEIKEKEKLITVTSADIDRMQKELKEKEKSEEYKEYKEIKDKKDKYEDNLNSIKTKIRTSFAKFDRALKKYERSAMDNTKVIGEYLTDAYDAIRKDDEHKGEEIFKDISEKIKAGTIDLKNGDKIISSIQTIIDSKFIKNTNEDIKRISNDISEVNERLKKSNIYDDITDLKNKIETETGKIEDHKRRLEEMKKELESIDEKKYLKDIEELLNKAMNKIVKLQT